MDLEELVTRKGTKGRFHSKSYRSDLSGGGSVKSKEVVFKVASDITNANPKSVAQAMDYITRNGDSFEEEFIRPEDEMGNQLTKEEFEQLKSSWNEEFGEEKRKNARLMTHFVLSADEKPTPKNVKKFENATREFLKERFGDDGFRYVFVTHTDNGKIHSHVLVNNYNQITNSKLRMDRDWFLDSRIMAKEKLNKYGFNYKATLQRDRKKQKELEKGVEKKVEGQKIVKHGFAPYENDENNKMSYFIELDNGSTIWGVGLKDAMEASEAKVGDRVAIEMKNAVDVMVENNDGDFIKTKRNAWVVSVVDRSNKKDVQSLAEKAADFLQQQPEQQPEQQPDKAIKPSHPSGKVITKIGKDHYQFDEKNEENNYIVWDDGSVLWGKHIPEALSKANAGEGDRVTLEVTSTEKFTVLNEKTGKKEERTRNVWTATVTETSQEIKQNKTEFSQSMSESQSTVTQPSSDWYEAQLRKLARNDQHFNQLKTNKGLLAEARKVLDSLATYREARSELKDVDKFSNQHSSMRKAIRSADLSKTKIDKIRAKVDSKADHHINKQQRETYLAVQELAKTSLAVELSKSLTQEEKEPLLSELTLRKNDIDPFNRINMNSIKNKLAKELDLSPELNKHLKELKKLSNKKQPEIKDLNRTFRQTESVKHLSSKEQALFARELESTLQSVEKKGVQAHAHHNRWQRQQAIGERIEQLPEKLGHYGDFQSQNLINALSNQIGKVAVTRRDEIRLSKSLMMVQIALDNSAANERGELSKTLAIQLKASKSLKTKQEEGKDKPYQRQLAAMTKTYLKCVEQTKALDRHSRESVQPKLHKLEAILHEHGADIGEMKTKGATRVLVENSLSQMNEVLKMDRPTIEQLDQVVKQSRQEKQQLTQTDYTVTEQRETNKQLNLSRDTAILARQRRQEEFEENMQKLKAYSEHAKELNKATNDSPTAKFAIRKQLDGLYTKFNKLSKVVKQDAVLVGGVRKQFELNRSLETMAKSFNKGRGQTMER